jgi:hypothetical protein
MAKYFMITCWAVILCLIIIAFTSFTRVEYVETGLPYLIYEDIKNSKHDNVSPVLTQIVLHRIVCATEELMDKKWSYCTSKYTNDVFSMAKSTSETMSEKTRLVQCIRRCPIVYQICTNTDAEKYDCVEIEAKCLNYCTEHKWRRYYQIHEYTIW